MVAGRLLSARVTSGFDRNGDLARVLLDLTTLPKKSPPITFIFVLFLLICLIG